MLSNEDIENYKQLQKEVADANIEKQTMKAEAIKYAAIIVTIAPLLIMYPFFEKFFEKGMIVGSLKG